MKIDEIILDAFYVNNKWIPYFNILNNLFEESKIRVIHDAKTMSVAIACFNLLDSGQVNVSALYDEVNDCFTHEQLSKIIDLTTVDSFANSIDLIHSNLNKRSMELI